MRNAPKWELRNMVTALTLHSWLNTPEETERLEAAKRLFRERGWRLNFRGRDLVKEVV